MSFYLGRTIFPGTMFRKSIVPKNCLDVSLNSYPQCAIHFLLNEQRFIIIIVRSFSQNLQSFLVFVVQRVPQSFTHVTIVVDYPRVTPDQKLIFITLVAFQSDQMYIRFC